MILISVILPVFNAEAFLKEAISSVLKQTFIDFELIVIDDGSTDKSGEIIFGFQDSRIVYLRNDTNKGLVFSLNRGIKSAKGDFIARMDADDICHPERFQNQILFLKQNPSIGLCSCNAELIDFNGIIVDKFFFPTINCPLSWEILWHNPIIHPSVMFRKKILEEEKDWYRLEEYPAEDYGLWSRLISKNNMSILDEKLICYRISPNGIFHSNREVVFDQSVAVSTAYASSVLGKSVPKFHSYFYYQSQDRVEAIAGTSVEEAKDWLNLLAFTLAKHHQWSKLEFEAVLFDVNKKILRMILHSNLSFLGFIKSIFSLQFKYTVKDLYSYFRKIIGEVQ
jgi:glycosyltransferase involved in cell wall biosynthesis